MARVQILIETLEKEFGLVNQDPKSIYPNLRGEVDGVEIAVDVYFQSYTRSEPGHGQRPWMRVRAQLPTQPDIQVQLRGQTYSNSLITSLDWRQQEEGIPLFDQKYNLFVKEGAASENTLPPAVREALIAADPPVAILNKVVSWMKVKTGHSPDLIKNAVYSCRNVALAIIENS